MNTTIKNTHAQDMVGLILDNIGAVECTLYVYEPFAQGSGSSHLEDDPIMAHQVVITKMSEDKWHALGTGEIKDLDLDTMIIETRRWSTFMSHFVGELDKAVNPKDNAQGLNLPGKYVIGLMNHIGLPDDKMEHLLFFDMQGKWYDDTDMIKDAFKHMYDDFRAGGICLVNSGKSCHVYTKLLASEYWWTRYMNTTLVPEIGTAFTTDSRWVARCIHQGQATIRLTSGGCKPTTPKVLFHIGDFLKPLPAVDATQEIFEPDTDLPF